MDEKRLKEFANMENLDKFKYSGAVMFSDGVRTYGWYKNNWKNILSSSDPYSTKIKEDLVKYKEQMAIQLKNEKEKTIGYNKSIERLHQEFIDIEDLDKFNYNSKITFKNGMLTGKWFIKNANYLLFSQTPTCLIIKEQYLKKKRFDEIKRKHISRRRKLEFIACDNIYKYDKYNSPLFSDKTRMSDWFYIEYPNIKKSKEKTDVLVKNGYVDYCLMYELRMEFLDTPNEEKFEETGIARFTTGAIMYLWWEHYKEEILMSNNPIDIKISKQYLSYTTGDKKEVLIKK